jgi:hypothetical protein
MVLCGTQDIWFGGIIGGFSCTIQHDVKDGMTRWIWCSIREEAAMLALRGEEK